MSFGAVTFVQGGGAVSEIVSATNSLVGSSSGDQVGSGGFRALTNPHRDFIVLSPLWELGTGAVTWGNGANGQFLCGGFGVVNSANSIVGNTTNTNLAGVLEDSVNNTILAIFPNDTPNSGTVIAGLLDSGELTYARAEAQTMTIQPCFLTTTLNAGSAVILQANNDVIINSPISYGPGAGNLTISAGRSVTINQSILSQGGDISIIANDDLSSGVIDSQRTAGDATLTVTNGATINAGTGTISLNLKNGAGKTNASSGDVTLSTNSQLIVQGLGSITVQAAEQNITLTNGVSILAENGSILFIAGLNIQSLGNSTIQTTGSTGSITLVVDNLFSTPPAIGPGLFNIPFVRLTGSSVALYAGAFGISTFPEFINGTIYVPGQKNLESYGVYYPNVDPQFYPYHVFYKTTLPVVPPVSIPNSGLNNFWIAISEPLQQWADDWWVGQLFTPCKYLFIPFRNEFIRPYTFLSQGSCSCKLLKEILTKDR
jgi:hypothetical protein